MINVDLLAGVAARLLISLRENESHPDVRELLENARFIRILRQAMDREIHAPIDLGMGRWSMESNLCVLEDVSELFAQFELALEGRSW
jgi:hypothetical protein